MDPTYLTTSTTAFGPAEWVFFIASIAVALAGIYLAFLRGDTNPLRARIIRQLGFGLFAAGLVGGLLGSLRLAGVAIAPLWFMIVTIVYLLIAIYAVYFASMIYPRQLAAAQSTRARPQNRAGSRASVTAAGTPTDISGNGIPRPAGIGNRRESRRDRKRRSK